MFKRLFRLPRCWARKPAPSHWYWVHLARGDHLLGPYSSFRSAEQEALNRGTHSPRILVELGWRHPWHSHDAPREVVDEVHSALDTEAEADDHGSDLPPAS